MKKSALLLGGVSSNIQGMAASVNIVGWLRRRRRKRRRWSLDPKCGWSLFLWGMYPITIQEVEELGVGYWWRDNRLSLSLSLSLCVCLWLSLAHSKTVFPWIQGTTAFSWSAAWLPPYQRVQCMVEHKKIIALFKPILIRAQRERERWSGVQLILLGESEKLERNLECNWS
jgi:hypothetical protein